MVSCFSWFFVGFSGFSRWLCGYHGFWLVSLVFKVVSTILLDIPGFLGGFCFFMVSCMIWKASVCHVEKTPKPDRLNCIKGTTIQSRPASTTNCRFLLFAKSFADYGNWMGIGDPAFKKAVLNTWVQTLEVMAGDAWCNVYALSFTGLKTIFV